MNIMEFEELKKIWDTQNNEPMYAINETALHRSIQTKRDQSSRLSNTTDRSLILIAITTGIILLLISERSRYDYLSVLVLLLICGYVLLGRSHRKQQEQHFEHSMLGDLNHAIANVNYEITRSKTFVWWFLLPVAIPVILNMVQAGAPSWKWLVVPFSFFLSYLVVRWGLQQKHLPKKRELELLKDMLTREVNEEHSI